MQPFRIRKDKVSSSSDTELPLLYEALVLGYQRLDRKSLSDPSAAPEVAPQGDIIYPKGWQASDAQYLLQTAPKTLWLLSRARLIPVPEIEVLRALHAAGIVLEPPKAVVANVQHVAGENSVNLLRMLVSQPRFVPKAPPKAKIFKIGGDES
jgi:hypothetical protein